MIQLAAENIKKSFGGLRVLDDINLEIRPGCVTALIGPNGAGKTTLANIITGFTPPDSGRIKFAGQDITRLGVHHRAGLGMGRTFQNLQLFASMSVKQNIILGRYSKCRQPTWLSAPSSDDHAEADAAIARMGLTASANKDAGALSFGQSKMLELARLHAMKPALIVMDEPAAGLPGDRTSELAAWIRSMTAQGIGMMLIEHNMRLIMDVADYVYVLDHGHMIAKGLPHLIRQNPIVLKAYLGDPGGGGR